MSPATLRAELVLIGYCVSICCFFFNHLWLTLLSALEFNGLQLKNHDDSGKEIWSQISPTQSCACFWFLFYLVCSQTAFSFFALPEILALKQFLSVALPFSFSQRHEVFNENQF